MEERSTDLGDITGMILLEQPCCDTYDPWHMQQNTLGRSSGGRSKDFTTVRDEELHARCRRRDSMPSTDERLRGDPSGVMKSDPW